MDDYTGKVAVVTGGSGGIGRAAALAFGRRGARVAVADMLVDGGEETIRMIRQQGGEGFFIKTDVSRDGEVQAFLAKTVETFGGIDVAFNNAGIEGAQAKIAEYPVDVWERIVAVNLTGVWLCMKHEVTWMLKRGKGSIVNTASSVGLIGASTISGYVATKFAIMGITRTVALEYANSGIRVNAVCPGFVDTPFTIRAAQGAGMAVEDYRQALGSIPAMKRMGTPEEIADAVLWLCSDAASYVTGHGLVVDGGWIAGLALG
jgi:NAD(P)-dependent dehydrogenase (short-subunit alcohol dehydrogenase family)